MVDSKPHVDVRIHETQARQQIPLTPQRTTTVRLRGARPLAVFELVETATFAEGSAVLAPTSPSGEGLGAPFVLAAALQFIEQQPEPQHLLVAGHGPEDVSSTRAAAVHAALLGDRARFGELAQAAHGVADWQRWLAFCAQSQGWETDPGAIDGISGPNSQGALSRFRATYNQVFPQRTLPTQGALSEADWRAFLDVLDLRLARLLRLSAAELTSLRAGVTAVSPAAVGCAAHWPLQRVRIREHELTADRRVDILLFEAEDLPKLACHAGPTCDFKKCDVYRKNKYQSVTADLRKERRGQAQVLEFSDLHFHTDSAVFLPGEAGGDGGGSELIDEAFWADVREWEELFLSGEKSVATHLREQTVFFTETAELAGISAIVEALRFVLDHPDRLLLVAGHTDRAGSQAYNVPLSEHRAVSIVSLLEGNRQGFVDACEAKHVPEDDVEVLRYMAGSRGWPCDPGPGPQASAEGVRAFQEQFNADFSPTEPLSVDGVVGPKTRGAYFDVYMDDLGRFLGGDAERQRAQAELMWVDATRKGIGCGESFPKEQAEVDGLASEENRRVEVLFFEPHEVPPAVSPDGSSIYAAEFTFLPLDATDEPAPEAEVKPLTEGEPSGSRVEKLVADMPQADDQVGSAEDPWDFMNHFHRHRPARFGAQLTLGGEEPEEGGGGGGEAPAGTVVISALDAQFAPGVESLDVEYLCQSTEDDEVTLEVTSPHYTGPIHTQTLSAVEKANGAHTLSWNGQASTNQGALKDNAFLNPLFSPYTLRFQVNGQPSGERTFQVLYHSLELEVGPWTPDEAEPPKTDQKRWVQFQLNELGYHAGPVGGDVDDSLRKAILSYKGNHKALFADLDALYEDETSMTRVGLHDTAAAITPALLAALEAGDNQRPLLRGGLPAPGGRASLTLDASLNLGGVPSDGGDPQVMKQQVEDMLINRPLVPLEAKVLLRGKGGGAVDSPRGVGPVRVNWTSTDAPKQATPFPKTPASPTRAQDYLDKAYATRGGQPGADNCHRSFGGIRTPAVTYFRQPWVLGKAYVPHETKPDQAQKVIFSAACVDGAHPKRVGRAGALFRPSKIACDAYTVRATLDFKGRPNKAALEQAHGSIEAETGTIEVRRAARVCALVRWVPDAELSGVTPWDFDMARAEFAAAGLDLDISSVVEKTAQQVMTSSLYLELVRDNVTEFENQTVEQIAQASIAFNREQVIGRPHIAPRGPDQPHHREPLGEADQTGTYLLQALGHYTNFFFDIQRAAFEHIATELWRENGPGVVVLVVHPHPPFDFREDQSDDTDRNKEFVLSQSAAHGRSLHVNMHDDEFYGWTTAHEIAHLLGQDHWEHADDMLENGQHIKPHLHDNDDHNCVMSYSQLPGTPGAEPHEIEGNRDPHFCGKCHLLFRGWDVTSADLPAGSDS